LTASLRALDLGYTSCDVGFVQLAEIKNVSSLEAGRSLVLIVQTVLRVLNVLFLKIAAQRPEIAKNCTLVWKYKDEAISRVALLVSYVIDELSDLGTVFVDTPRLE
jgi:hypothetical protein